jgi:predicted glycosyltransferase
MTRRVLIHVQHLLGTGHLRRAAAIAAALANADFDVEIVSGGPPIAGLETGRARLFQLPALRTADLTFKHLIDDRGQAIDATWRADRREALLARFRAVRPDVLITELFPFGRRALEFELVPLLETAWSAVPRPLILCSLRDVLVAPSDPDKTARAVARARRWYDCLLVHGDPALIDLPASYPAANSLSDRIVYTGYIGADAGPAAPAGVGDGEVIVSAGGAAVGLRLFEAAAAARRLGAASGRPWRFLLGADLPAEARQRLLAHSAPGLIVEPARRDFQDLLRRCHISVSQGGYNTIMDLLATQARAVIVPFAGGGETEQAQRAAAMAAKGWVEVVPEDKLEPEVLAAAIDRAARGPKPDRRLNCLGTRETVRLVSDLLDRRGAA